MKANRKFVEGEEAVSAVIGVILMVAITVAIAATVYVYVSGMITPGTGTAKTAQLSYSSKTDTTVVYKVTSADEGIIWNSVTFASEGNTSRTYAVSPSEANVDVSQYVTISGLTTGTTYQFDMIFDDKIIWTSAEVTTN